MDRLESERERLSHPLHPPGCQALYPVRIFRGANQNLLAGALAVMLPFLRFKRKTTVPPALHPAASLEGPLAARNHLLLSFRLWWQSKTYESALLGSSRFYAHADARQLPLRGQHLLRGSADARRGNPDSGLWDGPAHARQALPNVPSPGC